MHNPFIIHRMKSCKHIKILLSHNFLPEASLADSARKQTLVFKNLHGDHINYLHVVIFKKSPPWIWFKAIQLCVENKLYKINGLNLVFPTWGLRKYCLSCLSFPEVACFLIHIFDLPLPLLFLYFFAVAFLIPPEHTVLLIHK